MKITLSKSQWEKIGRKNGWMKTSQETGAREKISQLLQEHLGLSLPSNITDQQLFKFKNGISDVKFANELIAANPRATADELKKVLEFSS